MHRPQSFTAFLRPRRQYCNRSFEYIRERENTMMDLLYVGLLIGFIAISVALVYGFEKLRRPS